MAMNDGLHVRPWEPEEAVGTLWHRLITPLGADVQHAEAAVTLEDMQLRMGVVFRALGGARSVELRPALAEAQTYRRSFLRRLGHDEETAELATFDGEVLTAPTRLASFASAADNAALYLWLAGLAAALPVPAQMPEDALEADIVRLRLLQGGIELTCAGSPGLAATYRRLAPLVLADRKTAGLSGHEAAVEEVIRHMLGAGAAVSDAASQIARAIGGEFVVRSGGRYAPFKPVPLWPTLRARAQTEEGQREHQEGRGGGDKDRERKRATRHKMDRRGRRDSLILHRFETIKTWVDFLNLNRKVEDEDETAARKAASDRDELSITDIDKRPATKLAFDLDLAPQDIDRERLAGECLYPEWDQRRGSYIPDHVRVLASEASAAVDATPFLADPRRRRRIAAVRRQFEALRPRRMLRAGELDGEELDTEAAVRLLTERAVGLSGSERIFRRHLNQARDLSVATLIDTSRSTESVVEERPVIETAQEALLALAHGLHATGDAHAMFAFSSLRRDRVYVSRLKRFEEPMSAIIEQRIAGLRPGFYTRLGAAIRHVARELAACSATRRLLLIITDGKPNDLDHYEGRHGVEDTRKAVQEARLLGHAVFAITIDRKALSYVPHIFGRNGFAMVARPSRLAAALPQIYRHLVTG